MRRTRWRRPSGWPRRDGGGRPWTGCWERSRTRRITGTPPARPCSTSSPCWVTTTRSPGNTAPSWPRRCSDPIRSDGEVQEAIGNVGAGSGLSPVEMLLHVLAGQSGLHRLLLGCPCRQLDAVSHLAVHLDHDRDDLLLQCL